MYYAFRLSAQRRVEEADYNTFVYPLLHPDRVMRQHDFLYTLNGKWEVALEQEGKQELFQIREGDLLILPAGVHHYGTCPCSPNSRNMYLHVEAIPGDHPKRQEEGSSAGQDSVLLPTLIHCADPIKISSFFSEIITVYGSDSIHRQERLSCLFELLLCEISEQESESSAASQCLPFVNRIARFIQTNPERFFSVSEIAGKFCVSEKTLNNRFKAVYHKTFYAWQMDQKLDSVYRALKNNPDSTLKETAVNFGFYDEFHLSRAFKKKFGAAPKYVR